MSPQACDVLVLGAGGAGLMCALQAGRRGKSVQCVEHNNKIGSKILISGGGRCNFTNLGTTADNYLSENQDFAKSALSRFKPQDFLDLVNTHGISYHEKKLGQLFCDQSAKDIVRMLEQECRDSQVEFHLGCRVEKVEKVEGIFRTTTNKGEFFSKNVVVATGGLSIPKIGATGIGYRIAGDFGLTVIPTAPALDGFRLQGTSWEKYCTLSGLSVEVKATCDRHSFIENILFTHQGLSGPAALQASLYWTAGREIELDLLPKANFLESAKAARLNGSSETPYSFLQSLLPKRFLELYADSELADARRAFTEISLADLERMATKIHQWKIIPGATVGYGKAEVTRGGVSTLELSSKTMEAKKVPGLYFIGEVVDVTGQLGGFNFQWAWASGWAAAQAI